MKCPKENKGTGQVMARETIYASAGQTSPCEAAQCVACVSSHFPPQPSPALLGSTVRSDHVCQLSACLSYGSVLTGVSEAGTAHVASSALEEGLDTLLWAMSCPSWRGSEVARGGMVGRPGVFRHIPVLWPPGSPFALLRRKPRSFFTALQIWWRLK